LLFALSKKGFVLLIGGGRTISSKGYKNKKYRLAKISWLTDNYA